MNDYYQTRNNKVIRSWLNLHGKIFLEIINFPIINDLKDRPQRELKESAYHGLEGHFEDDR